MERSSSTSVGLVGAGIISGVHGPYIRKAGADVVAIADADLGAANDLADRFDVQRTYADAGSMLAAEELDVVHVLTPPHTHAEIAVNALEAGVHVVVEKPAALSVEEVNRMVAAADKAGRMLCVDHNRLFDPVMLEARRLVADGVLGDLVGVESYQAGHASERAWLSQLTGGGLGDLLPHPLYLQLAFLGPVDELQAWAFDRRDEKGPRELRVLMKSGDVSGMLTISMNAHPQSNTLRLYGTRMTVDVNLNNMTIIRRVVRNVPKLIGKSLPNLEEAWQLFSQTGRSTVEFLTGKTRFYPGMGNLLSRFYSAVDEGGESPVSVDEARSVVDVTQQIWAAIAKDGDGAGR